MTHVQSLCGIAPAACVQRVVVAMAALVSIATVSTAVAAQSASHDAHAVSVHAAPRSDATALPGTPVMRDPHVFHREMDADMAAMMAAMDAVPMTGSADVDFAAMMIPHHQGAIAMARRQLQYGTDPAMRRLAQEIIVTQQSEIELMQRRLEQLQAVDAQR